MLPRPGCCDILAARSSVSAPVHGKSGDVVPGGGSKDERASVGRRGVRSDMCLVCRDELCVVLDGSVCAG